MRRYRSPNGITTWSTALTVLGFLSALAASLSAHAGPNDIAIIIANKSYSRVRPVEFADRDGATFKRIATIVFGVPDRPTHIIELANASFGDLVGLFGFEGRGSPELTSLVRARDSRIYVFYSGHGLTIRDGGEPAHVLLPIDSAPARAETTAYRRSWVQKALQEVQRKKAPDGYVYLFLDACFSGRSDGGDLMPDTSMPGMDAARVVQRAEERMLVVAASSGDEVAYWDRPRQHGVFSHALLLGLFGAADDKVHGGNGDGRITAGELERFLKTRVAARLSRLNADGVRRSQTPGVVGDSSFELVNLPRSLPAADPELEFEERTLCRQYSVQPDRAAMSVFLEDCVTCSAQCRTDLRTKLASLYDQATSCGVEQRQLARLSCPVDRRRVADLAANAACPEVKAAAIRQLETRDCWTEDQKQAEQEQKQREREKQERQRELEEMRKRTEEAEARRREAERERIAQAPRLWNHNGSTMKLVSNGVQRQFYYENPRQGMRDEGVRRGTLLFEGTRTGNGYSGTAYVFLRGCSPKGYHVSGTISDDERSVTMYGQAPRLNAECRLVGYRSDELVFELIEQSK